MVKTMEMIRKAGRRLKAVRVALTAMLEKARSEKRMGRLTGMTKEVMGRRMTMKQEKRRSRRAF